MQLSFVYRAENKRFYIIGFRDNLFNLDLYSVSLHNKKRIPFFEVTLRRTGKNEIHLRRCSKHNATVNDLMIQYLITFI